MEKKCNKCKHVFEGAPNKCGLTSGFGVMKSCYDERHSPNAYACGREGKNWEPKEDEESYA